MTYKLTLRQELIATSLWEGITLLLIAGNVQPGHVLYGTRVVGSLGMILALPGYAIQSALVPCRGSLRGIERIVLSGLCSVAVIPPLALALEFLFGMVTLDIIVGSLVLLIAAGMACSVYRRNHCQGQPALCRVPWQALASGVVLVVAISVLVAANPLSDNRTTEFYITRLARSARDASLQITLGVVSHEPHPTRFQIAIQRAGQDLRYESPFTLGIGQEYELFVVVNTRDLPANAPIQVILFRDAASTPYRILTVYADEQPGH